MKPGNQACESWGSVFQAEGIASAKALRPEPTWCVRGKSKEAPVAESFPSPLKRAHPAVVVGDEAGELRVDRGPDPVALMRALALHLNKRGSYF